MALFNYFRFPFKSMLTGYQSYKFFSAVEKNKEKRLKKIIENQRNFFDLQEIYSYFSPLHVLIREGKQDWTHLALNRKDAKEYVGLQNNPNKLAPIHVAAKFNSHWVLAKLHSLNCNFLAKTELGTSAIHIAAAEGFNEFIEDLLSKGTFIDDVCNEGYTALFYAVLFEKAETVRFLLEKGAKTGSQCKVGSTPILNAVLKGNLDIVKLLYRFKEGHKYKAKYRLVHLASGLQSAEVLKYLHSQGENLREIDNIEDRLTCLHYAAVAKSSDCLKYLLKQGCYVDSTDSKGSTALHSAVIQADFDSVKVLCDEKADINLKNNIYLSPLEIAESTRNIKLVNLLTQYSRKS